MSVLYITQQRKKWLITDNGKRWLKAKGHGWLLSDDGKDWLTTVDGINWLHTNAGKAWLKSNNGEKWLSQDGQSWRRIINSTLILQGHTDAFNSIVYSPNGMEIASCSDDKTVKIWNVYTGKLIHNLVEHNEPVLSIVYSPDGLQLASASISGTIKVWDSQTGQVIHTLKIICYSVHKGVAVIYSQDGKKIIGAAYKSIKVWDSKNGNELYHNEFGGSTYASWNSIEGNGIPGPTKINTRGNYIYDDQNNNIYRVSAEYPSSDGKRIYSSDYQYIAVSETWLNKRYTNNDKYGITIYNVKSRGRKYIRCHDDEVISLAYSPDGTKIATGSRDKTVKIWNTKTGQLLCTLNEHTGIIISVKFSPDSRYIASGSMDNTIRIWEI
jgi:WD40 repeat protein